MKKLISIVIPTYNEETNIIELSKQIEFHMNNYNFNYNYELLFIDNCSTDNTQEIIRRLCLQNKKIKAIFNNRNFGYVRSPYYGILQAHGDAVLQINADFQDPPELIPQLINKWEKGSQVVFLKRISTSENFILEFIKKIFYSFINLISEIKLQKNVTGSGIYDKKIILELKKMNDPYPYMRGLILEIVDKVDVLEFHQPKRNYGISKSSFYILFDYAMLGIIKHSKIPLRIMTIFGFLMSFISFLIGIFFLFYKLFYWDSFQLGLAPLVLGLFFGISILIFMLGIIGEYVGLILTQVRNQPLVSEKERINFD
jgi:glycosyltransferase involved in cell wall biosynthesis